MRIRPPYPPPRKNKKENLHTTLATPASHHQASPLQVNASLYTLREVALPKRPSYFPRDEEEKEENAPHGMRDKSIHVYVSGLQACLAKCLFTKQENSDSKGQRLR
jgi:hypothetical protein